MSIKKGKRTALGNIWAFLLIIILTNFLLVDSLFSRMSPEILLPFDVLSNLILDPHLTNFGFSLLRPYIYCFSTWRTTRLMAYPG